MKTRALFVLIIVFTLSNAQRRGEWRKLSKSGSLSGIANRKYAFPPKDNLKYCGRRTIRVPKGSRGDYTKIFNEKMRLLGKMGGGTLKLDAGVYNHKGHIWIPSYVCLIGSGMDKTFIRLANRSPKFPKAGSIRSFETERVTIMHLTQDGNRGNQNNGKRSRYGRYGFFSELTNYLLIRSVKVKNNLGYGFDPHGSKKHWSYYLVMENCKADNNMLDGFTIDQTVHASIIGGVSTGNDRHGYNVVTGTQLAVFRDCVARNNGQKSKVGYGFVAQNNQNYGTSRIVFDNIRSFNSWRGAVKFKDVFDITVRRSKFTGKSLCYELAKTRNIRLFGNTCNVGKRKFKVGKGAKYFEK